MKRFLSLLSQAALISSISLTTIACRNPLANDDGSQPLPPDPIVKDVRYYQELIEETEGYVNDCEELLQEIKDSRDDYDDEAEYQAALDEVEAEKFFYLAQISEYYGAILFLEADGLNFTHEQILQGVIIFTAWVSNLEAELKLKEKYPDYYTEQELQEIRDGIKLAKEFLEFFLNLKED